jgi:DNA modification methylase
MKDMELQRGKVSDFTPDPANANRGTERGRKMVRESVERLGAGRSIVVDKNGIIIAGNQTHSQTDLEEALIVRTKGDQLVVVQRSDLDLSAPIDSDEYRRARELAIADNRSSQVGLSWDSETLSEYMDEGVDLDTWFMPEELEEILGDDFEPTEEDEEAVNDDIEAADDGALESRVQIGQIWACGRHRIACGDSTDEGNIRALLGDRFGDVGMVWADPPFGIDLQPQRKKTESIANDTKETAPQLWDKFIPVVFDSLRDNCCAYLCQGWSEFDWTLPIIRKYFEIKTKIVWKKTQWGIGYYFRPQHEDILYCWKGKPETPETAISNVWEFARPSAPIHSCQKPVELVETAFQHSSKAGDLIFDPFLGSAPSLIAAQQMQGNRTVYGFELSPQYCEVILRRYEKLTGEVAELVGNLER